MSTVLSTKKLTKAQQFPILQAGIALEMYDSIHVRHVDFPLVAPIENAIFTSKNAVHAVLNKMAVQKTSTDSIVRCFCVGEKTKEILEQNCFKVIETAKNGAALTSLIKKKYSKEAFTFFSGNLRMEALPEALVKAQIPLKEITVYKTALNAQKFTSPFDGVLFFSPSGVESYFSKNTLQNGWAFCIGDTTAQSASTYTHHIRIASTTTVEAVVDSVLEHFKITNKNV